ncbi:GyrI-like domain-containing protein [Paenibacillus hodogayensis]|uniref:GyrI-like domain-containing protein n=1 Tax=Paenibacillus hodogayensis TaxID=279208 RepID=A0ABV5W4P2_9BACL
MITEPAQPKTVHRNETKLVGYTVTTTLKEDMENEIIGSLRERLLDRRSEIASPTDGDGVYLVQLYPDCEWTPDVPFESIVAVEVHTFVPLPEGFVCHTIPAGAYTKVTHRGPESRIGDTYDWIRDQGLGVIRPFDFEYWADCGSLEQEESVIDIYWPIEA